MEKKSIQLQKIVKDYPGARVLDGISFCVGSGTIHGFLGPNGAGKSTTINIVTGLIAPTRGDVLVGGRSIFSGSERLTGRIGLLPGKPTPLFEYAGG